MNRFFYVTKELFQQETVFITTVIVLILLGLFTSTVINFIILIIVKTGSKKRTPFKKRSLIRKFLHPNVITTFGSLLIFLIAVILGTFIYTDYWELNHKNFKLDNLKYSELQTLGFTSSYIDSFIDTKIVAETTINGIELEFYSTPERSFNENEILIIKNIFKNLPEVYRKKLPKKVKIYSYANYQGISAMAVGNHIYLSDNTFTWSYPTLKFILIHELTHTLQYNNITSAMLEEKLIKGEKVELVEDSTILQKYIKTAGWEKTDNKEGYIIDTKIDHHLTTDYGKYAGPVEDMADSTALFLIGQGEWLSQSRQQWIQDFFGKPPYNIYDLGYIKGYKYISTVPTIDSDLFYYPLNEDNKSDLAKFTYTVEKDFYEDLKKDKKMGDDKYMLIYNAYLQNEEPDDWDIEVEKWINKMKNLGWKLEDKKNKTLSNKIKTVKLTFTAPDHKITLELEDRRTYNNQDKINETKKNKAYYEKYEIDTSLEDQTIEDYKNIRKNIREEGIFITVNHGINFK